MPRVRGQLEGGRDLVADEVDRVEILREADEVTVIGIVAGAASVDPIVHVGRTRDEAEDQVIAAEHQLLLRVAGRQRELAWRGAQHLVHEFLVDPHDPVFAVDGRAPARSIKKFSKPPSIIKMAFYIEDNLLQDELSLHYAHWTMSLSTLQSLAQDAVKMSAELKTYYNNYINTSTQEKRIAFSHFVHAYQEFYGYLLSIRNTIIQYYNLFVLTCNQIDPNNKEHTIFAKKSDIGHDELLAATKELLLHGNMGRLAGFALLRAALETSITRELFNPKKSQRYSNNQIIFLGKDIPTLKAIWKRVEKLHLERYFKTDSLKRLYTLESKIVHQGYCTDEYLIWFLYYHTVREIIGAFKANLKHYGDQILEELQKDGLILIK